MKSRESSHDDQLHRSIHEYGYVLASIFSLFSFFNCLGWSLTTCVLTLAIYALCLQTVGMKSVLQGTIKYKNQFGINRLIYQTIGSSSLEIYMLSLPMAGLVISVRQPGVHHF